MVRLVGWLVALFLLVGCVDPWTWTPTAEVEAVQWVPLAVEPAGGELDLRVSNTGQVTLSSVDIAVEITSDRERYVLQERSDVALVPGNVAFHPLVVTLRHAGEVVSLKGIRIVSVNVH